MFLLAACGKAGRAEIHDLIVEGAPRSLAGESFFLPSFCCIFLAMLSLPQGPWWPNMSPEPSSCSAGPAAKRARVAEAEAQDDDEDEWSSAPDV